MQHLTDYLPILCCSMANESLWSATTNKSRVIVVDIILITLIVFDLFVAIGAFLFPSLWYDIVHDAPYIDPQALLRRTGAIWVAFSLIQMIAVFRWRIDHYWLVLVSGIRLSEMFADWTYLLFAESVTVVGTVALLITLPANLAICWFFFRTYQKIVPKSLSQPSRR